MSAQQYRLLIDHFTKKMVMRFTGNDGCKVSSRVYAFFLFETTEDIFRTSVKIHRHYFLEKQQRSLEIFEDQQLSGYCNTYDL